jgi:tetratricopeptide (TPR) repeat protein
MPRFFTSINKFAVWTIAVTAILLWVLTAGYHHWWRACLLTGLASAAFVIGALVGFVFTTYDEESDTIGKVKDWLIGSLAAITLVKFDALKPVLLAFSLHNTAADFALSLSVSIVFVGLGFFFMFFGRELLFNVPLARERAERNRVEAGQTSVITIHLLASLPSSILVGIDDAENLLRSRPAEAAQLKAQLWSDDVNTFLQQSQAAIANGAPLDWDVVSKNGYLQYYRTYFTEATTKAGQASCALQWVVRALVINPEHIDLTIKHADLLGILDRNREAVLERLHPLPECPAFVDQWLGYYLLFLPNREEESIRCSTHYLNSFPESNESRRNLACAYAQKLCRAHGDCTGPLDHEAENYREAIHHLRIAVHDNPDYLPTIREKWVTPRGPFACFLHDPEFRQIVQLPPWVPVNDTLPDDPPPPPGPKPVSVTEAVIIPATGRTHEPAME